MPGLYGFSSNANISVYNTTGLYNVGNANIIVGNVGAGNTTGLYTAQGNVFVPTNAQALLNLLYSNGNVNFALTPNGLKVQANAIVSVSGTGSYSNANVAVYLASNTDPTIQTIFIGQQNLSANLGAYQTFANANAATQATEINTINANLGAFETYANLTFGTSNYGNANVAAYLPTYSGQIGGTIVVPNFSTANAQITGGNTSVYNSTATNKFVSPHFDAANSAGGQLRNAGGTAQLQWGGGGGNNISVDVAININPANAQVSISPTGTGSVDIKPAGHLDISPPGVGFMNNVVIGNATPTSAIFTTIQSSGNITANAGAFFIGNGSQLTGIVSLYGNTQVAAYLASNTDPTISNLNANAAVQAISINSINANLGTATTNITTLFSNAGVQATGINNLNANLGAYQTWANANFSTSTYSNTNVAAFLPTYTGNIGAGNVNVTGKVTLSTMNYTSSGVIIGKAATGSTIGAVSIGDAAGGTGSYAIAIGQNSGKGSGTTTIAIGTNTAGGAQGDYSIAIGQYAGATNIAANAIVMGSYAGRYATIGTNSIILGTDAQQFGVASNSIIMNATGQQFNGNVSNAFFVNPVRNDTGNVSIALYYNTTTKEITYANASVSYGNTQVGQYLTSGATAITANLGNIITTNGIFWANGTVYSSGSGTYGNAEVTANLSTYTGQLTLGNFPNTTRVSLVSNATGSGGQSIEMGVGGPTGNLNIMGGNPAYGANVLIWKTPFTVLQSNALITYATFSGVNTPNTGHLIVSNTIVAGGNISAPYFIGDGSKLTNGYGNTQVAAYLPTYTGNIGADNVNVTGKVTLSTMNYTSSGVVIGKAAIGSATGAVTIGDDAGGTGLYGIAIGQSSGKGSGTTTIAIGTNTAGGAQGNYSIAIGQYAGATNIGANAIVMGSYAGRFATIGTNSIVLGTDAQQYGVASNSIIMNATGQQFNANVNNAFFVNPVRNDDGNVSIGLYYNTTTKEITYSAEAGGSYGNTQVGEYLTSGATAITANLGNVITTGGVFWANGTAYSSGGGGTYGNTQVAAFLNTTAATPNVFNPFLLAGM